MELDAGNAALSGIAGGLQGAAQGMGAGINAAYNIQGIESKRQEMAYKADQIKKAKLEEEMANTPIDIEKINKLTPPWAKKFADNVRAPYIMGDNPSTQYMKRGDFEKTQKELNSFLGKSQMAIEGIQWHEEEQAKIKKQLDPLMGEFNKIYKQKVSEIQEAQKTDPAKAYKLKKQIEKDMGEGGLYYDDIKKAQGLTVKYNELDGTKKALQTSIGKTNSHLEKIMEESGVDEETAIMAAQGSKYHQELVMEGRDKVANLKKKQENLNANQTEEQLTARSLRGDKEAQAILDAMQKRKIETATANRTVVQLEKEKGIDVPSLAKAVADGQDAPTAIKGSMGNPVATKVKSEILKTYPKFNFTMADANYKWKQSQTNLRTINYAQGSMQRVAALNEQVAQLKNADIPAINKVMRQVSINLGKPEYTNFESNRNAIVQEVNTALSGSATGSDLRVKIELENLNSARSPKQLVGAIKNLHEALFARLDVDLSPIYPIEVVRGEKSLDQYKRELYKKYKGDYGDHNAATSNFEPFDKPLPVKTKDGRDVSKLSDKELLKLLGQ